MTLPAAALLGLALLPQEVELKWAVPDDEAVEFETADGTNKGGGRTFLLSGGELEPGGGNRILCPDLWDLPYKIGFVLPDKPVKPGAQWEASWSLFDYDEPLNLLDPGFFKPILARGSYAYRGPQKDGSHRIESRFEITDLKVVGGDPKPGLKLGTITTQLDLAASRPLRLAFSLKLSKGREQQGETLFGAWRPARVERERLLKARPEPVKLDPAAHLDDINAAIRKGSDWLVRNARIDGTFAEKEGDARNYPLGVTALAAMALAHSGLRPDQPPRRAAFPHLLRKEAETTYEAALAIMAVETKYLPLDKEEDFRALTEDSAREILLKTISAEDRRFVTATAKQLVKWQTKEGTWGYPEHAASHDHSNTHYAMLGLKSASRCGVAVPSSVWTRAARNFVRRLRITGARVPMDIDWAGRNPWPDVDRETKTLAGGWGYFLDSQRETAYGSLVCAGLTALAVAESELRREEELEGAAAEEITLAQQQGVAWLVRNFSARGCPPGGVGAGAWWHYYLYGVERVGLLYGIRRFGRRDWYMEGALHLLRSQQPDGSWSPPQGNAVVDTSFALLFLKRAVLPVWTGAAPKSEKK